MITIANSQENTIMIYNSLLDVPSSGITKMVITNVISNSEKVVPFTVVRKTHNSTIFNLSAVALEEGNNTLTCFNTADNIIYTEMVYVI